MYLLCYDDNIYMIVRFFFHAVVAVVKARVAAGARIPPPLGIVAEAEATTHRGDLHYVSGSGKLAEFYRSLGRGRMASCRGFGDSSAKFCTLVMIVDLSRR